MQVKAKRLPIVIIAIAREIQQKSLNPFDAKEVPTLCEEIIEIAKQISEDSQNKRQEFISSLRRNE